jgi:NADPH:quinone reductase-like Zn-dependent oxidoreductase
MTIYQALIKNGKMTEGDRVLIYGEAGGIGCFAIQLQKRKGLTPQLLPVNIIMNF